MQQATIIGVATSTVKHPSLFGAKLAIAQPMTVDGKPDGFPFIVVDVIGAGVGDWVMITSDGRFCKDFLNDETTPARWTIVGLKD